MAISKHSALPPVIVFCLNSYPSPSFHFHTVKLGVEGKSLHSLPDTLKDVALMTMKLISFAKDAD